MSILQSRRERAVKRGYRFPLLACLLCLFLTGTAYAENAILSVDIAGIHGGSSNAAIVRTAAEAGNVLLVALYGEDGRVLETARREVQENQDFAVTFSAGTVPPGGYVRAFLLDAETFAPLCAAGDSRDNAPDSDNVYAVLYADGTLVFQYGGAPEAGRAVRGIYPLNLAEQYSYHAETGQTSVPWYPERASVRKAVFAASVRPRYANCWFYECENLTEIERMDRLDTSQTQDMSRMFAGCAALAEVDLSAFDTSRVTDMRQMFSGCSALTALDLFSFDTARVTRMDGMFQGCAALSALNLGSFDTSRVTDTRQMFSGCASLSALDLSTFHTSQVLTMTGMFSACAALKTIYTSENFVVSQVTESAGMFDGCEALTGGGGTVYDSEYTNKAYACADTPPDAPGYFTSGESGGVYAVLCGDGRLIFQHGTVPTVETMCLPSIL